MPANGFDSLGRSIQAYMPQYAPPVNPQTNYIRGGAADALPDIARANGSAVWDQHSRLVNRNPRRLGIRTLYSYGAASKAWFRMVATGAVESTKFQPVTSHMWDGEQNDAIYQAGYPRNLGLTFKVPTVNPNINPPWSMAARPNFRGRTIFTNTRPFTSGIPGKPATPTNGQYS